MARVTLEAIITASSKGLVKEVAAAKTQLLGLTKITGATAGGGLLSGLTVQAAGLAQQLVEVSGALLLIPAGVALVAQAAGTVKLAFSGVGEAIKSGGKEMGDLTGEAQGFVREAVKINEQISDMKKTAQANLMPGLTDALKSAGPLLPIVNKGIGDMATSLGDVAREVGKKIDTPLFRADLANILTNNSMSARNFGMAAVEMVDPLRDLVSVGSQVINFYSASTPMLARQVSQYAAAKRESGEMALAMVKGVDAIINIGKVFVNFGGIVSNVMSAANRVSGDTLGNIVNWLTRLKAATEQGTSGYDKLVSFFNSLDDIGRGTVDVVMGVAEGVATLSRAAGLGNVSLADFARNVRESGEAFRSWAGTKEVRQEIASFANDARELFGFLLDAAQAAASGIKGSNSEIISSFHQVILVLAAVTSPARALAIVFTTAMAGSEEFRGSVVELIGSLSKLAVSTLEAVDPFIGLAAAIISITATGAAPIIDGISAAVGFLADNMNIVVPLVIAFGIAWGATNLVMYIGAVGGMTNALRALASALGVTTLVSALTTAFEALGIIGRTLVPTLTGVRAALLGLAAASGVLAVLGLLVYAVADLSQRGKEATEVVTLLMSRFDVSRMSGVKEALASITVELERFKAVDMGGKISEELEKVQGALEGLRSSLSAAGSVAVSTGMSVQEFSRAVGANADAVDGSAESIRKFSEELTRGTANLQFIALEFRSTNEEAFQLAEALGINLQSGMREVASRVSELTPAFNAARIEMNLSSVEVATLASHFIDLTGSTAEVDAQLRTMSAAIQEIGQVSGLSAEGIAGLAKALGIDLADNSRTAAETLTMMELKLQQVPIASSMTRDALNAVGQAALAAKGNVDLFQLSLDTLAAQNNLQLALATTRQRIMELGEGSLLARDAQGQLTASLDANTQAGLSNEITLRGIISQILRTTETTYQQIAATEGSTVASQRATSQFESLTTALFASAAAKGVDIGQLQAMFAQLGITTDATGRLTSALHLVPDDVQTNVSTPGADASINLARRLARELDSIPRYVESKVIINTRRVGAAFGTAYKSGGALGGEGAALRGYQSGGEVTGRGTHISDQVLTALSPTEWVINSMASQRQGRWNMAALNAGMADIVPHGIAAGRKGGGDTIIINLKVEGNVIRESELFERAYQYSVTRRKRTG